MAPALLSAAHWEADPLFLVVALWEGYEQLVVLAWDVVLAMETVRGVVVFSYRGGSSPPYRLFLVFLYLSWVLVLVLVVVLPIPTHRALLHHPS